MKKDNNGTLKSSPHPLTLRMWGIISASWLPMLCIWSEGLPASAEVAVNGSATLTAIVGDVARRACTERAAGSIGRSAAVAVAEAHRGIVVAVTRPGTVAVVH